MNIITFKDLPDTTTLIDADNLNQLQSNVNNDMVKKIEVTILKIVTDTAPEECLAGELYYNTSTNLIYEAVDDDIWSPNGDEPVYKCFYLDDTNHALYYYNGTELVNYGSEVFDSLDDSSSINSPSVDAVNSALDDINETIDDIKFELINLNGWRCKKYNNGYIEMTYRNTLTLNISSQYMGAPMYFMEVGPTSFPLTLTYVDALVPTIQCQDRLVSAHIKNYTNSYVTLYLSDNASLTGVVGTLTILVRGTWK